MPAADHPSSTSAWRRHPEIAVVDDAIATFILPLSIADAAPILVDGSAREIWRTLDDWRSVEDIAEHLGAAYGVDPTEMRPQIQSFLVDLESRAAATRRTRGLADPAASP